MIRAVSNRAIVRKQQVAGWQVHLLTLVCYALLALISTYPLILHMDSHIIANKPGSVDGYLSIWSVWWAAESLQHGHNPFFTPLLFFPDGLNLFWQNNALCLPQGLLAFPLTLLAGPLFAYNVLILASYVLGGYTAFLFVRYVTRNTSASIIAGAIYSLAPFHLQKVVDAQIDVASIQWVPLYLLALHVLLTRQRWQWALLAGLLLVWVGLGSSYYVLFCLFYTGLAAAIWAFQPVAIGTGSWYAKLARWLSWRTFFWGMTPAFVWLAVMFPFLISLVQTGDTYLGEARNFNERSSADIISFWLPSPLHPLWGSAIERFYDRVHHDAMLWNVSFGLVAVALAAVGIARTWRANWRWLLLLGATMILSMGEELRFFGIETGIPLPYKLLAGLPGIRASHRPNHIVILSILLVALLAAYGAIVLFRRWPRQQSALTGALIVAVLLVDGWAAPMPLFTREIPAGYANLPAPDGGLLPIPIHLNLSRSENLWYQTVHRWPIVGGFIGREPPYPLGKFAPGIRELRYGERVENDILALGWPELARETLAAYDIRYVIYHPNTMGSSLPRMRDLMNELGFQATYRDPTMELYPVPAVANPHPLVYLGAGWGGLEQEGERRWRWVGEQAELYLLNPLDQPRRIELELQMESYERNRPLSLRLDETALGSIEVSRAAMRRTLWLWLEPGEHVLYLGTPTEPTPGAQGRQLGIAFLGIELRAEGEATHDGE